MLTRDDWNEYYLGSPYWHSINDRILIEGVNDKEFFEDLFQGKGGPGFKKNLDCPENRKTLIRKYEELNQGEPIIRSRVNDLAYRMMISGSPDFVYPYLEPEAPADERPRDSLGRIMSSKALRWRDWTNWVNDPKTSMRQINELRRTDPGFAEFYTTVAAGQRVSDDPMAAINAAANNRQQDPKKKVSDAVQQFAAEYRTLPTERLRTLLSPGRNPLGPADAARVQSLYDAALSAGLL